jgi:hypothetical protein
MNQSSEFVQCINCKWATYKQWFKNPVVATCGIRGDKQVAATKRICKEFRERVGEAQIEHFDHYD